MSRFLSLLIISFLFCMGASYSYAQAEDTPVRYIRYFYSVQGGDTIFTAQIHNVTIFPPLFFRNDNERLEYDKLVRDIKRTLPYAKTIAASVIETYETMQTLPNEKSKQKHLEQVQKYMMDEYKPKMKKLTRNQGKILIKLIDRECNTVSFNLVKSLIGSLKANVYNVFAGIFGNSLKTQYDPKGKDKMIERIATLIEQGAL